MRADVAQGNLEPLAVVAKSLRLEVGGIEAVGVGFVLREEACDVLGHRIERDVNESVGLDTLAEDRVSGGHRGLCGNVEFAILFGLSGAEDLGDSSVHAIVY